MNINEQRLYELGRRIHRSKIFLDRLDLTFVKRIHINGGEPLINDDHLLILRQLRDLGRLGEVNVSYNTNGTQKPSADAIELWKQCKLIKLYFSIDGTQQSYEYIRWPGKWLQTVQNLLELRDTLPSNVMFGFNVTVAAYNIFEIADVLSWFKYNYSTNREQDLTDFVYQTAKNFDLKFLCKQAKQAAIQKLEPLDEFQGIVTDLKNHINYCAIDNWCNKLDKIDQRRGTDWRQVLQVGKYY